MRGFHFRSRMFVACASGSGDAGIQRGSGLFRASGLCQELAILEVPGDVFGMRGQERFEMFVGSGDVAGIGALHRQAIASERIGGFGGDEIFEDLASRFLLWLGQGHAHSIFARGQNAKFLMEREPTNETIFNDYEIENSVGKFIGWSAGSRFAHRNDGAGASSGLEPPWKYFGRTSHAFD